MNNSYQKTALDTIINAGAQIILIPLLFLRMPVLTKNLSIQEYGILGLIFTTCSLSLTITSLGLGGAMSRFLPSKKKKKELQEGFYSVLFVKFIISFFLALSLFIFSPYLANNIFDGNIALVKITALLVLLTTLQPVYIRLFKIFRKVKVLSAIKIIEGYGTLLLYIIFLVSGYGLIAILYIALLIKMISMLFMIFYLRSDIGFYWPKFSVLKMYLKYGLPTLPASISFWLVNLTDRYIITFLLGTAAVGIYSAAYTLGSIPYIIGNLINFIMLVALSELYDEGKIKEVKTHLSYSLKYFLTLIIPFVFGSIICSEQALKILGTYEIATKGSLVTPIVALAYLFLGIYNILNYVLLISWIQVVSATVDMSPKNT